MTRRYSTWGHRKNRSRKARRDSTDACTRHFPNEGTFNSSEMFIGEISKLKDVEKEGESKNDHLTYGPESADGSSHSASDLAAEIQKTMDDVEPSTNTMECLDLRLLKEKDSCSLSPSYVEGSIPQGSKTDFLPLIIERSQPFVTDDSCPPLPTVEPEDGSSQASESAEQSFPRVVVNPNGSNHSPLDPALEIEEQEMEAGLFASVNDVQQSHPSYTEETSPTLSSEEHIDGSTSESWEQPQPLEVVKPWEDVPKSILGSNPQSNYSQPMQSSGLDVGNTNVLDSSKACLFSRSMSKTAEPSSPSNGGDSPVEQDHAERTECLSGTKTVTPAVDNVQGSSPSAEPSSSSNGGDSAVEKNSTERTECLSGTEIVTPALDNVQGSSPSAEPSSSSNEERDSAVEKNSAERTECLSRTETVTPALDSVQGSSISTAKESLVSDVDNSDEANRADKHILCSIENKESGQVEVPLHLNILNSELHCSHNGLNESSHPNSELKGRNTQDDVPKASVSAGKNVVCSQVSQTEDDNSEALPSKNVSPCKATESNFKKRSNRHTQCHTKHQETKLEIITRDRNADPAQLKSCRPSKQLDHACSSVASELSSKTKEVNNANDAEPMFSSAAQSFENIVPMKRNRLILPCDEDEDAKAMQVGDSNPPSSKNDGQQRRENKDKNAPLRNPSVRCTPNDAEQLASEAAVTEGHRGLSRMPVFSAPTDQEHFICPLPVDRPYWIANTFTFYTDSGIMKIGQEYISLAAHLSTQACKKVQELSRSLPPVMKVTKHSKLKAWPKRRDASSEPTAESIGLYFFSDNMRPNKDLDRLVQYVTDHSIILKYVFGSDKLLIFPSVLLPEQCQTFQGKPYLWGVFKRRSFKSKAATQVKQKVSRSLAAERKDHEDKVQGGTQDQEMPVSKGTVPSERQPSPGAAHGVGIEIDPSDRRKPHTNSEAPPPKLLGLVVAQTPRSEQFIKELENEGALVFAVNGLGKPGPLRL
ncbi:uncharacterized protein C2845_PM17G02460 [Panicum miliaceum]|uniref:AIPP2-like SPOC-like domain-containing protein n=1 Tax=Panicum miliaceum TaxID=4540 RepID=A0A3L6Q195_PANMI|nr:uncharacterized protein C2845_PM17G02460 [Panicum miliaceum]